MLQPEAQGNQSSSNLRGDRELYLLKENKMDHILSASGDAVLRGTGKGDGGVVVLLVGVRLEMSGTPLTVPCLESNTAREQKRASSSAELLPRRGCASKTPTNSSPLPCPYDSHSFRKDGHKSQSCNTCGHK